MVSLPTGLPVSSRISWLRLHRLPQPLGRGLRLAVEHVAPQRLFHHAEDGEPGAGSVTVLNETVLNQLTTFG